VQVASSEVVDIVAAAEMVARPEMEDAEEASSVAVRAGCIEPEAAAFSEVEVVAPDVVVPPVAVVASAGVHWHCRKNLESPVNTFY